MSDNTVNELFKDAITEVLGKMTWTRIPAGIPITSTNYGRFFISQLSLVTSESVADFFAGHKVRTLG